MRLEAHGVWVSYWFTNLQAACGIPRGISLCVLSEHLFPNRMWPLHSEVRELYSPGKAQEEQNTALTTYGEARPLAQKTPSLRAAKYGLLQESRLHLEYPNL